jgi:hypothetical protein
MIAASIAPLLRYRDAAGRSTSCSTRSTSSYRRPLVGLTDQDQWIEMPAVRGQGAPKQITGRRTFSQPIYGAAGGAIFYTKKLETN